jgi:pimeloyl-ACP methyl ester carboxylesterase
MMRERMLETGRGRIRCLDAGAGWPVLLIHAFPLSAEMWRPVLDRVPDGWRFIAPDTRGFGETPLGGAPLLSIADYAADAEAVLNALEIESAVVGGLSMGGYVALALHRRSPELVTGLVLADTKAEADTPEGREGRRAMSELVRSKGMEALADTLLPKLLGEAARGDLPLVRLVRRMIVGNTVEGTDRAIQAMLGRPDSTPDLPHLSVPVLVVVGEEDQLTPVSHSEAMQRGTQRSQLVVLPGAGHLSSVEAPEAFSIALANFLRSPM